MEAAAGLANAGRQQLDGERFLFCVQFAFHNIINSGPAWTQRLSEARGHRGCQQTRGEGGASRSSMVSQEQQRALAGHTQPSLVPCYVLPVDPRTGCLEGAKCPEKGPGSEGRVGHPEGSRLRGEVLAMPVLEPLPTLGEAGPPGLRRPRLLLLPVLG